MARANENLPSEFSSDLTLAHGVSEAKDRRIAVLEQQVRELRAQMDRLSEETNKKTEELLSANEEVLSSNESRDYAERILGTMDLPLILLNANMRVRMANEAFYHTFRTSANVTEGALIYELGDRHWDVHSLREQLLAVLVHGTPFHDVEVKHVYPESGERTFLLGAKRIDHEGVQPRILVTIRDITERRKVETDLSRLAAIVTSSADAIMSMELNGNVLTWNVGAERLFGYSADTVVGSSLALLLPADRLAEGARLLERVRNGESISNYETVRVHKDGHEVPVVLTMSPVWGPDGTMIAISKNARDVTLLKRAEHSLLETEERFRLLADNMDQLAWISKPEGGSTWFNKRMLDYFGMSGDEIRARGRELHHPDFYEAVAQGLRESAAAGEPWESVFPLKGRDGNFRWFLSRTTPLKDRDGTVLQWFGTSTDITDRMQAEAALRDADRRKDEFLATLAHELRNPLAPLRSGVEILSTVSQDPAVQKTREVMTRQVNQLVRLVDDLMDVSRITSGRLVLTKRPMDVREAARSAVEAVRSKLEAKGQHLAEQFPAAPLIINGDAARITQVLTNLLHNASKFSEPGTTIDLRMRSVEDRAEISVHDNGIGIQPAMHERVFDMFAQVDAEEHAKLRGGLGIGLHIVKRITLLHDGEITVSSAGKSQGTTFVLRLPLLTVSLPTVDREAAPDLHSDLASPSASDDQKVLVVDDNSDSAAMLSLLLNAVHCDTRVAHSCDEALQVGDSFQPALIFCDIGMPMVDGYETCRRIRQTAWGKRARIMALTGWGQESDRKRSEEAGFDAHLVKPVDRATLLDVLSATSA